MRHHQHAGLAGRLAPAGEELQPHPDAVRDDARVAWFPVATADARDVDALEGLMCVPTRPGAMRIAAVPHVVEHLSLGDEVAVADWEGEPMARGELALALAGTIRCVVAPDAVGDPHSAGARGWRWLAQLIDEAAGGIGTCWFDAIGDHAVAAAVPRDRLTDTFAALEAAATVGALRWEYVTTGRH